MTGFSLEHVQFDPQAVNVWSRENPKHTNWPVVYILNNDKDVYVGQATRAARRLSQHLKTEEKQHFKMVRVILDDTFNQSACFDLESYLIQLFHGDDNFQVLNRNDGMLNNDYYNRDAYKETFNQIFEELRQNESLFTRTIPEIESTELYKLSPFKALNEDQATAVVDIVEGLFEDLESDQDSLTVIQGNPGTGKTIIAIYLLKLLEDIKRHDPEHAPDTDNTSDTMFSEFFTKGHPELLKGRMLGFVIPQQSLRKSVEKVFKKTAGLRDVQILTPFQVGESAEKFDVLIVDEAHRLNLRANQPSAAQNKKFREINEKLYGEDDPAKTQLDWIHDRSKHTVLLLDPDQSVRPADLSPRQTTELISQAQRHHLLRTQMRIDSDKDFVKYVKGILSENPPEVRERFNDYDLRFFTNVGAMRREIEARDAEFGLARLVAGYAWPWKSKGGQEAFDIEIDGEHLQWNKTATDWINSKTALQEVGSIHTVQGYDLNYAGVIIGPDLKFDPNSQRIVFDRAHYFDTKGMENNPKLGITYSDEDILTYVRNIYTVLLTRGIRGTYIYVCDPHLREYLRKYF